MKAIARTRQGLVAIIFAIDGSKLPAASVDPEILHVVYFSLIRAKLYLLVAVLVMTRVLQDILICNLLAIDAPSVRQYGVGWSVLTHEFGEAEAAVVFPAKETHIIPLVVNYRGLQVMSKGNLGRISARLRNFPVWLLS
jgi:hypothetical protein